MLKLSANNLNLPIYFLFNITGCVVYIKFKLETLGRYTFHEAEYYCNFWFGAHLASIYSDDEYNWIK